jgi:hypothetical protein
MIMPEIFDIVNSKGIELVNNIRANLGASGQNASLKTSQSLRFEIKEIGKNLRFQLYGRPFFMSVETGRKPTKEGATTGDPTLFSAIEQWIKDKGIVANPWAVTKAIHEKGTKLWRDGGRTDIVEPAVDTFINDVSTAILDKEADNFILKVKDGFSS